MTHIAKPRFQHPLLGTNELGLSRRDYEGSMSTLCAGCGHDSISAAIIQACAEMSMAAAQDGEALRDRLLVEDPELLPVEVPRLQLGARADAVHRDRLEPREPRALLRRVSGDGDTASIGLGQFAHAVRRQVNMLYVVENNGTYGLTKASSPRPQTSGCEARRARSTPTTRSTS